MLEWCLNSSIRHPDLPGACPVGICALGKMEGPWSRDRVHSGGILLSLRSSKIFFRVFNSKTNPFYADKGRKNTCPMKIISLENSSSIYYGGFSRRPSIFHCSDTIIKMQTFFKKQQNKVVFVTFCW